MIKYPKRSLHASSCGQRQLLEEHVDDVVSATGKVRQHYAHGREIAAAVTAWNGGLEKQKVRQQGISQG